MGFSLKVKNLFSLLYRRFPLSFLLSPKGGSFSFPLGKQQQSFATGFAPPGIPVACLAVSLTMDHCCSFRPSLGFSWFEKALKIGASACSSPVFSEQFKASGKGSMTSPAIVINTCTTPLQKWNGRFERTTLAQETCLEMEVAQSLRARAPLVLVYFAFARVLFGHLF